MSFPHCVPFQSVVCIFSAAYSGSTLLALMVGSHPEAIYIGEVHALPTWIRENRRCGCGQPIRKCLFWRAVSRRYENHFGFDFFSYPDRLQVQQSYSRNPQNRHLWRLQKAVEYVIIVNPFLYSFRLFSMFQQRKMVRDTMMLYDLIGAVSGARIIVDSTKAYLRIYNLYQKCASHVKVLCLVRDGRAVSYSHMKRHNIPMEKAATLWKNTYIRGQRVLSRIPEVNVLQLKYEGICNSPNKQAQRIARFLSISFHPSMLDISNGLGHSIAGNTMKWRAKNAIQLNERWKSELSRDELDRFETIAGNVNRRFGYPHHS